MNARYDLSLLRDPILSLGMLIVGSSFLRILTRCTYENGTFNRKMQDQSPLLSFVKNDFNNPRIGYLRSDRKPMSRRIIPSDAAYAVICK